MSRYRVWDLPVRLFHWSLVALVVLQWASGEFHLIDMGWHVTLGYATLALLLFRLLWGLFGSANARFAHFLRGPREVLGYIRSATGPVPRPQVGHNPLGGWSVLAMLLTLLFQSLTGLFASDDVDSFGPLSDDVPVAWAERLTDWHEASKWLLLALIVLHVVGVLYHHLTMRDDLIGPMVSGSKELPADPGLHFASSMRAALLLALACAAVWIVTTL